MLKAFIMLLISTLLIVGTAWWFMNETAVQQNKAEANASVEQGFLKTRQDFNDKMEEFKRRKNDLLVQIERFELRKKKASEEFRAQDVNTAEELEGNDIARRKYDAIRQDTKDIEKLNEDIKSFDEAISAIESGLRELDREELMKNVGVNDETYRQLRIIVKDLDERLARPETPLEKMETQSVLDDILGKGDSKE